MSASSPDEPERTLTWHHTVERSGRHSARLALAADEALVFNVQHYSLHDGPGIRTTVFLKGCPLRCGWCCNPESQGFAPEVSYRPFRCLGFAVCGRCDAVIPGAVEFNDATAATKDATGNRVPGDAARLERTVLERATPAELTRLVASCPTRALTLEGERMSVEQILGAVERDEVFYSRSGGGMTVSGGEPLFHRTFLPLLLAKAHERGIDTAVETCGYAAYATLAEVARNLDTILFDIKTMDSVVHRAWTGYGNERILENFVKLCEEYPGMRKLVRTPVVPGFNDSREAIGQIVKFLRSLGGAAVGIEYQPLRYHRFGAGKYAALGRTYPMGTVTLDASLFEQIRDDVLDTEFAAEGLKTDD